MKDENQQLEDIRAYAVQAGELVVRQTSWGGVSCTSAKHHIERLHTGLVDFLLASASDQVGIQDEGGSEVEIQDVS